MFPELEDSNIFTIFKSFFSKVFVSEKSGNIEKGSFWAIKKSEECVAEDVFKTRAPRVAEHTFQNANNFGTDVWFS